ncbi:MAG TPA: ATP-binding protein [Candidatus Dormibacteraeota bacterium]|jgi:DNA replication protein DnaC|nr:ATP-binding protein [Candidatus Dormibacteraeota bacterium]
MVPRPDGAGTMAAACDCGMEERAALVMNRARIPKRYEHCDFESYSTDVSEIPQHSSSLKAAKMLAEKFVGEFPGSGEKGLMLMGPSGVGKTHLAVACLKELIRRGHQGLFCDYRELLKDIQASYNPGSESTELRILEPIRTVEVLVLDDLGASKPSAWVLDTIGLVLNARYNSRLTTLITTNYLDSSKPESKATRLPQGEALRAVREDSLADRIGERMRSRLFEMCRTIEVNSTDFRREVGQSSRARA